MNVEIKEYKDRQKTGFVKTYESKLQSGALSLIYKTKLRTISKRLGLTIPDRTEHTGLNAIRLAPTNR